MITISDLPNIVVRDRGSGLAADDLGLQAVEVGDFIVGKPAKVHDMSRVGLGHRQIGQSDLVEIGVAPRPKHIAPSAVQRIGRLLALRQPIAKGVQGCGRIGQGGGVAGIFIVGLPRRNMRFCRSARQGGDDLGASGTVGAVAGVQSTTFRPAAPKVSMARVKPAPIIRTGRRLHPRPSQAEFGHAHGSFNALRFGSMFGEPANAKATLHIHDL